MRELELLSPAGDLEIFKSVVNAGADAVYFGGDLFGARAYAKNFTLEEAKEAIHYAHIHNVKAYLTVNTLLKNLEMETKLYDYLKGYVESGIDAFIVQDMGVFSMIKDCFPDTHIHASTQMSISSKYGAKYIEKLGASRIVTSRELSLEEISEIHNACPNLEIESFIHGALCVCYSGQCLMSSIIGGRSGNRGRCAQPCRLPYSLQDANGRPLKASGNYILSPKDFCTIEYLPQMIKAGVCSFKIEGRMKQLNYATGVVSMYRKYLDKYLEFGAQKYSIDKDDMRRLYDLGNRSGFTNLYLKDHNGAEMITFEEPSHKKSDIEAVALTDKKIALNAQVYAALGQPLTMTFNVEGTDIYESGEGIIIEAATGNPTCSDDIKKNVLKVGNTPFVITDISVNSDEGIFLPVSAVKGLRREILEKIELKLSNDPPKTVLPKPELAIPLDLIQANSDGLIVKISSINQLKALLPYKAYISKLVIPYKQVPEAKELFDSKEIIGLLPVIIRKDYIDDTIDISDCDGIMACSVDGLGLLERIDYPRERVYLDNRIYTMSDRARNLFTSKGYINDCISYELSLKELGRRYNHNSSMIIYSRIPLMVTANCSIKNTVGCNRQNMTYRLKDRTNSVFLCQCDCDNCYNVIYNCKPYMAFSEADKIENLGPASYRIDFTLENNEEICQIMDLYIKSFIDHIKVSNPLDVTKGHLNRGVE